MTPLNLTDLPKTYSLLSTHTTADEHRTLIGGKSAGNYKVESIDDMQQRQTMAWIRIG